MIADAPPMPPGPGDGRLSQSRTDHPVDRSHPEQEVGGREDVLPIPLGEWAQIEGEGQLVQSNRQFLETEMAQMQRDPEGFLGDSHEPLPKSSPPWGRLGDVLPCHRAGEVTR